MGKRKKVDIGSKPGDRRLPASGTKQEEWVAGPDSGRRKRLTIDISEALHRKTKMHCVRHGRQMAEVVREFLEGLEP